MNTADIHLNVFLCRLSHQKSFFGLYFSSQHADLLAFLSFPAQRQCFRNCFLKDYVRNQNNVRFCMVECSYLPLSCFVLL